jgi:cell division protein FtsL
MIELKGRHWVVLWLALFLLVAVVVETRQLKAYALARELQRIRQDHKALDATRADFERQITQATSRQVLQPKAEALGLHTPSDAEEDFITPTRTSR